MAEEITFEYSGKKYAVGAAAWYYHKIQLPDGTLIKARDWTNTCPPLPLELYEIRHEGAIVRYASAIQARLV